MTKNGYTLYLWNGMSEVLTEARVRKLTLDEAEDMKEYFLSLSIHWYPSIVWEGS